MRKTRVILATVFCLAGCTGAQTTASDGISTAGGTQPSSVDAAVRKVIVETAVFVEECGKLYPSDKPTLDAAFAEWVVLKLPIPNLMEALKHTSPDRVELSKSIGPYLRRIPGYEKEIECSGRYEMITSKKAELHGDSASLPPDVLDRYSK